MEEVGVVTQRRYRWLMMTDVEMVMVRTRTAFGGGYGVSCHNTGHARCLMSVAFVESSNVGGHVGT